MNGHLAVDWINYFSFSRLFIFDEEGRNVRRRNKPSVVTSQAATRVRISMTTATSSSSSWYQGKSADTACRCAAPWCLMAYSVQ